MNEEHITPADSQPSRKRMPKWLKTSLISLGALVGVVAIVLVVACYLIFTPARLTSIVNKLSNKYILCESSFEKVDLTLFRTFPDVGLEVKNVKLNNPIDATMRNGDPVEDELAKLEKLTVAVNIRDFLKKGDIKVTQLLVDDVDANLYIAPDGRTNFDIFQSGDTTESEPFELPDNIDIKKIKISNFNCRFVDEKDGMDARLSDFDLKVGGHWKDNSADGAVKLAVQKLDLTMCDSSNVETLMASLDETELHLNAEGPMSSLRGKVDLEIPKAQLRANGTEFITEQANAKRLLKVDLPFNANLEQMDFSLEKASVALTEFIINLTGSARLANETEPMNIDMDFSTNTWEVAELMQILPAQFVSWAEGMDLDAKLKLNGHAAGTLTDTTMPKVNANLALTDGRFSDRDLIPYDLKKINGSIDADLDLSPNGRSNAKINNLTAVTGKNDIALSGKLDDILGRLYADLRLKGNILLADLKPLLPADMPLEAKGKTRLDIKAKGYLDQVTSSDFKSMKVDGKIDFANLDVRYDDIAAQSEALSVAVQIPAAKHTSSFSEMLSATVVSGKLHADVASAGLKADVEGADISAGLSDVTNPKQPFSVAAKFKFNKILADMDSLNAALTSPEGTFEMVPDVKNPAKVKYKIVYNNAALACKVNDSLSVNVAGLSVAGTANYDSTRSNVLQQWSPDLKVDFKRGYINVAQLPYMVQIPDIKFNYKPERCEISSANIVFGNSDYYISGSVTGLEKWLSHEDVLHGELNFTSNYTNVDDLLDALSGLGTDPDTLEQQRKEDNVSKEANPFIVPKDVDVTLHTRIKDLTAFGNDLQELGGNITVRNGTAVLDQIGFVCKAAKMQLTALYKTPRVNHIFLGLDFHLLDIGISELIDMIPAVDTLVPMLSAFDGNADFHLCAETYVDAFYQPKMSTLRGVAALTGKDLVVLDSETFDKIAKLMMFKKSTRNVIDSLDVEMTVFRKEVELYPFLLSMDKYQVVASGRHNLDNNYNYHLEILQSPLPTRLAVDVLGVMPKLGFKLGKCRYAELYKPEKRNDLQKQTLELKGMIRKSLESNVKQDTRTYQGLGQ
ncbi:MAG: AsmA family protein [Bacteroidales bacterium]|nr:AsmA family protein [Bacteroidales bacterium]